MDDRDPEVERRLALAAGAGDRRAAEDLLGRLYDQVYAVCRRICAREADAEDATQDALISIARALPRFDGRSAVRTWAYRIATNAALDELRRRSRRADPVDIDARFGDSFPDQRDSAPALDERVGDRIDIDGALTKLPVDFRAAVVLRDLMGMEYADIADTLGVPVGTVRSRIARGRRQLADLLMPGHETAPAEPSVSSGNQSAPLDVQADEP